MEVHLKTYLNPNYQFFPLDCGLLELFLFLDMNGQLLLSQISCNISKVVFITTDRTASASELVINSLRPYVDVKTVGATSYGKPVGFFPIRIGKYDVYMSMFSSKNAAGQGDYYAGFIPDAAKSDDVTRDFGNPLEISFSSAISYINTGIFTSSVSNQTMSIDGVSKSPSIVIIKDVFNPVEFKGMIDRPRKKN